MKPADLYKDPSKINWRVPVVIDFETYYDKEYSLSKITTEKYIRCDQFEMIGVSIKVGANPTEFYRREEGLPIIRELVQTHATSHSFRTIKILIAESWAYGTTSTPCSPWIQSSWRSCPGLTGLQAVSRWRSCPAGCRHRGL